METYNIDVSASLKKYQGYSWELIELNNEGLRIQVNFENPLYISQLTEGPD